MKLIKRKIPDTIEEYCTIRTKAHNEGYRWTNDIMGYMIFEEKKKVLKTKPLIDDTILYHENRESWKSWTDTLKDKYKEFRHARYETHKDYVSPLGEKKLLNIINKYPQRIGIALLESSLTYKSIVEKQDVIDKEMKVIQEENKKQSEILQKKEAEKHKEEVTNAKEARRKKIEASGYPESYWIEKAKEQLRQQGYKEEFMGPMIPTTINKLLGKYT